MWLLDGLRHGYVTLLDMGQRLLINWVYYQPVGHAIEAYRLAGALHNANPDLAIAVAVNARSGPELASCVRAVDEVYPIAVDGIASLEDAREAVLGIPRDWDYMYSDPRQDVPMGWDALDFVAHAMRERIRARLVNNGWETPDGFPRQRLTPLTLELPAVARSFADDFVSPDAPTRISLLLGSGTDASRTPPLAFWRMLIGHLRAEFAGVEIVLLGALARGRSVTQGIDRDVIDRLTQGLPDVRDAFDVGLLNQLAIAERCDLHISPHTGMSFAIQSVGVPWLVLAGGEMHESVLNGVPFVSVYTDCPRYPCGPWFDPVKNAMLPECQERHAHAEPFLCMTTNRLAQWIPDILRAARLLIEGKLSYHECARAHYKAMLSRIGEEEDRLIFFDWPRVMDEDFIFPAIS